MKLYLFKNARTVAVGAVLAAGLFSVSARADGWDKRTQITIDQPMQIQETLLQPGTYVLRLLDSSADRHVVQIFQGDGYHIINTVLANRTEKALPPSGHSQFTFWETPPGTARALRDWYYPGDISGNEFPMPKHPQQIAMATTTTTAAPVVSNDESTTTTTTANSEPTPPAEAVTPPAVETEPAMPNDQDQQTPVAPPPPTPAPDENGADRAAAPPTDLPKTASPYPLFGFLGVGLAGLAGLLRIKRTA